jgi:hypothetical protein
VTGLDNTLSVVDVGLLTSINPSEPFTPASGTYTPTVTAGGNVSAATPNGTATWGRSGNAVTVSGEVNITPTTGAGALTSITLTLPTASTLGGSYGLSGVAAALESADVARIRGVASIAGLSFNANSTVPRLYSYIYQYLLA